MIQKDMIQKIQELSKKNDNEMTAAEYKELQKLKKLLQTKKNRKVWVLIMSGIIVIGVISVCMLTSCLSSNQMELDDGNVTTVRTVVDNNTPNEIKKLNTVKFVSTWNSKVINLKYDYIYLKIDFEQYKIPDNNVTENVLKFLEFNKNEDTKIKLKIEKSNRYIQYIPIQRWIEERNMINYKKKKGMNSSKLMEYFADIVNPGKTFSDNTIDKIIQLNEFCYYFERNKENFYRDGYTRNITSCSKIQEKLDEGDIDYRLK